MRWSLWWKLVFHAEGIQKKTIKTNIYIFHGERPIFIGFEWQKPIFHGWSALFHGWNPTFSSAEAPPGGHQVAGLWVTDHGATLQSADGFRPGTRDGFQRVKKVLGSFNMFIICNALYIYIHIQYNTYIYIMYVYTYIYIYHIIYIINVHVLWYPWCPWPFQACNRKDQWTIFLCSCHFGAAYRNIMVHGPLVPFWAIVRRFADLHRFFFPWSVQIYLIPTP